jgi:hypothetical protein
VNAEVDPAEADRPHQHRGHPEAGQTDPRGASSCEDEGQRGEQGHRRHRKSAGEGEAGRRRKRIGDRWPRALERALKHCVERLRSGERNDHERGVQEAPPRQQPGGCAERQYRENLSAAGEAGRTSERGEGSDGVVAQLHRGAFVGVQDLRLLQAV